MPLCFMLSSARFEFTDQPTDARRSWLLIEHDDAEVRKHHPGFDEGLVVETHARTFALGT